MSFGSQDRLILIIAIVNIDELFASSSPTLIETGILPRWSVTANSTGVVSAYLDSSSIWLSGVSRTDLNNTHLKVTVTSSDQATNDVVY